MGGRSQVRAGVGVLGAGALAVVLAAPPALAASGGGTAGPGHVRVDTTPEDARVTPAPATCDVALRFAGYDEGQRATVTFSVKAPQHGERTVTPSGEHEVSDDSGVLRKGDQDAVLVWTAAELDLTGSRPHPDKGHRVTVAVDVVGDQQGRRVEQFWLLPCDPGTQPPGDGGDGDGDWDWNWDGDWDGDWNGDGGSTDGAPQAT